MYAMTTTPPRPRPPQRHYPDEGLEASRKVGWARFYVEQERADGLATVNAQQRLRLDCLLEALADLVHAVLHDRNLDAFAVAYRIQLLLEEAERG